jgi:hypothetical protein
VGLAAIGWFFVAPHADAQVTDAGNGDYVIQASPGMGYAYRWDADGDGKPDDATFGSKNQVKVHLEADKAQHVGLEVENAFGLHGMKEITVTRAAASSPGLESAEIGQR